MSDTGKQLVPAQKNTLAVIKKHLDITDRLLKERALALAAEKADLQTGFTDPVTGMEFVYVKGGTFTMDDTYGDRDVEWCDEFDEYESTTHQVTVSDFYIGRYPVTQGEWQAVMGSNPSYFTDGGSNCPVEQVSWDDIQIFISKLNHLSGKNYRLPTEAEWEYAARSGGKREKYSGGNDVNTVAWYYENSGDMTHPVGQKQANGLGLYDMSGNVWEWVNDWYGYYSSDLQTNPVGPLSGTYRVFRGGGWHNSAYYVRASIRRSITPDIRGDNIGFRLVAPVQYSVSMTSEKTDVTADSVTVTATDTGLAESLIYTDPETGLMWTRKSNMFISNMDITSSNVEMEMEWEKVKCWVRNLNYAGYNDWRLPTRDEFELFTKRCKDQISSWHSANGFTNFNDGWYWSDTENHLCFLTMGSHTREGYNRRSCYVWPVRGGQAISADYEEPPFDDDDVPF